MAKKSRPQRGSKRQTISVTPADEDRLFQERSGKFDPEKLAVRDATRAFEKFEEELTGQSSDK